MAVLSGGGGGFEPGNQLSSLLEGVLGAKRDFVCGDCGLRGQRVVVGDFDFGMGLVDIVVVVGAEMWLLLVGGGDARGCGAMVMVDMLERFKVRACVR